jgi:putative membrane protein insertion efficiency factor
MFKVVCKALILLYKKTLSAVTGKNCAYTPTCSMYAYDAVDKYGAVLGGFMGFLRILRCHPWAKGGYDPVKENWRGKAKWTL